MRPLYSILLLCLLVGCGDNYRVKNDQQATLLSEEEGYLGFVINTMDPLTNIQLRNVDQKKDFYVGGVKKGATVFLLHLPESEYCLIGFDVYNFRVDYEDQGFCTYLEAGEVNYFSEFLVRDPVTTLISNFKRFVALLSKSHPKICQEYIGKSCSI